MQLLTTILLWCLPVIACSQPADSSRATKLPVRNVAYKPEILSSGFIDIVNNGQVNASARFIRLQIGEPGKFSIPLSLYSGVSNNNFQSASTPVGNRSNEHLVNQYINPLSGLINLSVDDIIYFDRHKNRLTRSGLLYHAGARILTGYINGPVGNPSAGKPVNFLNSYFTSGLYFQTGAWEKNNSSNMGVFWIAARYILCKSTPARLRQILPSIETSGLYHGWSAAWGVEINNLVNIKVVYYKYVKKPEIEYTLPIYQFTFHYSLR